MPFNLGRASGLGFVPRRLRLRVVLLRPDLGQRRFNEAQESFRGAEASIPAAVHMLDVALETGRIGMAMELDHESLLHDAGECKQRRGELA